MTSASDVAIKSQETGSKDTYRKSRECELYYSSAEGFIAEQKGIDY